ncbi:MAG: slipin family protein [Dehalococcoidia bacterium]|nr:slipin family protein [Dehalococcoidia bacterium]
MGWLLLLVILAFLFLYALSGIRMLYEYQRGVVFTLGKYGGLRKPGLTWIAPIFQSMRSVDMRITTQDIPKQEVITRDNITILANTVVYYRVERPEDAIIKIQDYGYAVRQYTQTALRDVVGNAEMDFMLSEREKIADNIRTIVDAETSAWGIDIQSIKIQEIELPAEMKRAMAKQAEAERERRAMIINSQGELSAAENLQQAAQMLSKSEGALHLRTLQTIRDIAADPSEKIIIFLPRSVEETIQKLAKG